MGLVCYSVCWDVFITVPFSAWGWRRVMRWMKRSLVLDERAVRTVITGGGNNSQPEHPSVWLTLLVVKLLYYNNNNNNKVSTVVFSQGSAVMILIFWSRRTCPSGNHFCFFCSWPEVKISIKSPEFSESCVQFYLVTDMKEKTEVVFCCRLQEVQVPVSEVVYRGLHCVSSIKPLVAWFSDATQGQFSNLENVKFTQWFPTRRTSLVLRLWEEPDSENFNYSRGPTERT